MKVRRRTASAAVAVCGSLGAVAVTFAALLATPATAAAQTAAGPHAGLANARVVFCGDSITGQGGGWLGAGYCFQMEWALKQRHPDATPKLVALGGSGMGVGNWIGVEKNSRTTEAMLDVKEVGVKANLDQPADVLVVMLGMNDVLAPYIGGTDADLDTEPTIRLSTIHAAKGHEADRVILLTDMTTRVQQTAEKSPERPPVFAKSCSTFVPLAYEPPLKSRLRIPPKITLPVPLTRSNELAV